MACRRSVVVQTEGFDSSSADHFPPPFFAILIYNNATGQCLAVSSDSLFPSFGCRDSSFWIKTTIQRIQFIKPTWLAVTLCDSAGHWDWEIPSWGQTKQSHCFLSSWTNICQRFISENKYIKLYLGNIKRSAEGTLSNDRVSPIASDHLDCIKKIQILVSPKLWQPLNDRAAHGDHDNDDDDLWDW